MDLEEDQVWNESDRYHYMFTYIGVERAYLSVLGAYASVTAADVFVKLLEKHSFSEISAMLPWDLEKEIADVITALIIYLCAFSLLFKSKIRALLAGKVRHMNVGKGGDN